MDFNLEKFSYRLTALLEECNMKQKELAEKVGTTNVTICRYINAERIPRIDVAIKIASVFNVSLDYLLGISDSPKNKNSVKNIDLDIALLMKDLYSLKGTEHLSKTQLAAVKNLLISNKNFILSLK